MIISFRLFSFVYLKTNHYHVCIFVFVYLGSTSLIIAVETNKPTEIIKLLLQNGADVNAKTDTG